MTMLLRPYVAADLPRPAASESEFDDFGPESTLTAPPPWTLWEDGHLAVEVDGTVIGDVGWHWTGYGPGTASRCPMVGISLQRDHRGTLALRVPQLDEEAGGRFADRPLAVEGAGGRPFDRWVGAFQLLVDLFELRSRDQREGEHAGDRQPGHRRGEDRQQ